jgi:hypothetical protein
VQVLCHSLLDGKPQTFVALVFKSGIFPLLIPTGRSPLSRADQALFAATVNHHVRMHGRDVGASNDTRPNVLVDILHGNHNTVISDQMESVAGVVVHGPPVPWVHLWSRIFAARVIHPAPDLVEGCGSGPHGSSMLGDPAAVTICLCSASVQQGFRTLALALCCVLVLVGVCVEIQAKRVRDTIPWAHATCAGLAGLALVMFVTTAPVDVRLEIADGSWNVFRRRAWIFRSSRRGMLQGIEGCKVSRT